MDMSWSDKALWLPVSKLMLLISLLVMLMLPALLLHYTIHEVISKGFPVFVIRAVVGLARMPSSMLLLLMVTILLLMLLHLPMAPVLLNLQLLLLYGWRLASQHLPL